MQVYNFTERNIKQGEVLKCEQFIKHVQPSGTEDQHTFKVSTWKKSATTSAGPSFPECIVEYFGDTSTAPGPNTVPSTQHVKWIHYACFTFCMKSNLLIKIWILWGHMTFDHPKLICSVSSVQGHMGCWSPVSGILCPGWSPVQILVKCKWKC